MSDRVRNSVSNIFLRELSLTFIMVEWLLLLTLEGAAATVVLVSGCGCSDSLWVSSSTLGEEEEGDSDSSSSSRILGFIWKIKRKKNRKLNIEKKYSMVFELTAYTKYGITG